MSDLFAMITHIIANHMITHIMIIIALFGRVITAGRTIMFSIPTVPICEGSSITLDGLQNSGTINLIPSTYKFGMSSVFILRIMFDSFLER